MINLIIGATIGIPFAFLIMYLFGVFDPEHI